ncbi:MAG: toll/interleukin-1 receptor domain-containing protein, partial [Cyanobacteria bacterium J06626_18]
MQKIKLLLASSPELKEDSEQFEIFIYRKCKAWFDWGIFLHLDIWEDFLDATEAGRLQSEYNQAIQNYDIFILLAYNQASKYIAEEFEHVFGQFSATGKPFIFTYFKTPLSTANQEDLQTLRAFEAKLKALNHYRTPYRTFERLQEHFDNQLEKLAANEFTHLSPDTAIQGVSEKDTAISAIVPGGDSQTHQNVSSSTNTDSSNISNIKQSNTVLFSDRGILESPKLNQNPLQKRLYEEPFTREEKLIKDISHPKQLEIVDCSVFGPKSIALSNMYLLQVFIHLPNELARAIHQAEKTDDEATKRTTKTLGALVSRGDTLSFQLIIPGLATDDPIQSLVWRGQPVSVDFGLVTPDSLPYKNLIGTVVVSRSSVPIGMLKFKLVVVQQANAALTPISDTARLFRKAFVSYSSEDRREVLKRVQMLANVGIAVFQDILNLEPGERWKQRLYQEIDTSDLFLLFWSRAAKESQWVMQETRYALERQGAHPEQIPAIIPIILESPPITLPPPELMHLHFQDPIAYLIAA